jgi:hypothetical protein
MLSAHDCCCLFIISNHAMLCCAMLQESLLLKLEPSTVADVIQKTRALQRLGVTADELLIVYSMVSHG